MSNDFIFTINPWKKKVNRLHRMVRVHCIRCASAKLERHRWRWRNERGGSIFHYKFELIHRQSSFVHFHAIKINNNSIQQIDVRCACLRVTTVGLSANRRCDVRTKIVITNLLFEPNLPIYTVIINSILIYVHAIAIHIGRRTLWCVASLLVCCCVHIFHRQSSLHMIMESDKRKWPNCTLQSVQIKMRSDAIAFFFDRIYIFEPIYANGDFDEESHRLEWKERWVSEWGRDESLSHH